ncbi:MAG: hypothetical protein SFU56_21395 [Capsulimonadales bacterium]|nr:hypothetical protein [Capsulimonadales bacterium]
MSVPHFDLPVNLPHAGNVALRICRIIENHGLDEEPGGVALAETAAQIEQSLLSYRLTGEDPDDEEAEYVRQQVAEMARRLVEEIESAKVAEDRLGQCVRNLFECLGMGEEGAVLSLRAGENPKSLQRPA